LVTPAKIKEEQIGQILNKLNASGDVVGYPAAGNLTSNIRIYFLSDGVLVVF